MANSNFRHTLKLEGNVSSRAREMQITKGEDSSDTLEGLSFELTSDRETRTNRAGEDYPVDPKWSLRVFNFDGDPDAQALYAAVQDLRIGDAVSVEVAVIPVMRRGYPAVNLRVLGLENSAQ